MKQILVLFLLCTFSFAHANEEGVESEKSCKAFLKNDLDRLSDADEIKEQKFKDNIISKVLLKKGYSITKYEEEADLVLTSVFNLNIDYFAGSKYFVGNIKVTDSYTGRIRNYSYRDEGFFITSPRSALKGAAKKLPECLY